MHQTPAELAESGINAYTLSANRTRKLAFYSNLPAFLLLTIIFFLRFILNPFDSDALFQAFSLFFRPSSVSLMPSHQQRAVLLDILT